MALTWAWNSPIKRTMVTGCEFFQEGDTACSWQHKQVSLPDKSILDDDVGTENMSFSGQKYTCEIYTCGKNFSSLSEYEGHYNSLHRWVCNQCHRCFPNSHLLDIHVLEAHDNAMFLLLAQRQPMYQCLVEACVDKFKDEHSRRNHMIKTHKYPANFRFERNRRKDKPQQSKNIKTDKEKTGEVPVEMDVGNSEQTTVEQTPGAPKDPQRRQFSYKVPKSICFGQGSTKSFHRNFSDGRKKKGKHWHNKGSSDMDTTVDIEQVDMKELSEALLTSS